VGGGKKLIFQNYRLATATQEIKEMPTNSTNHICKKYKYKQIQTNTHD
jgi:hypothetical protein